MDLLKKYLLSSTALAPDGVVGGAQGNGDAGSDAGTGAGDGQQQQQQQKPGDFVTLADDDDESEIVIGEEGDDEDDGQSDDAAEGKDVEGKDEQGENGGKKRLSGSARERARRIRVEQENAELRRALARRNAPAVPDDDADLVEPKESDFPNDYLAFERAQRNYETRKAIRDENRRIAKANALENSREATREKLSAYNTRLETVKGRIPDFDTVMAEARGTEIRDDVLDQILGSAKGPLIAYHLAKNPDKVDALNRMSPLDAAREIGRLEGRIRGPQVKKTPAGKPPVKPLKGATGGASKPKSYADMSMEEFNKARDAEEAGAGT